MKFKQTSIAAAALIFVAARVGLPSEDGVCWGRVVADGSGVVSGARVRLQSDDGGRVYTTSSDASGWFSLVGLPPGVYLLRAEAPGFELQELGTIWIEPQGQAYLKLRLQRPGPKGVSGMDERRESTFPTARTVISRTQMDRLPTAHSVWSLIENQDFSATVNRIDVGGLWETVPALFSARGATSWTQNVYLLNGFDVTDPVWTGFPLFLPDLFALRFATLDNAALPIQAVQPGGVFELIPREGTEAFHGGFSSFYLNRNFMTSNVTPDLEAEGLTESNSLNRLTDFNVHLAGPLGDRRWRFFTSWTSQSVSRDMAQFAVEDRSRLASGLINVSRAGEKANWKFFWTGQIVSQPTSGAGRNIPPETTFDEKNIHNVFQVILESGPRPRSSYRLGLSLARADLRKDFQADGPSGPFGEDIVSEIPRTTAPCATTDARTRLSAQFDGQMFLPNVGPTHHWLQYGLQVRSSFSRSRMSIKDGLHLRFFDGAPEEIVRYEAPFVFGASSVEIDAFAQETVAVAGGLALSFGLQASAVRGSNPAEHIGWVNLSPRLSLNLPLSRRRSSAIRISAARYFHGLPLNYLTWGHPDAPGGLVYAWDDRNGDALVQPDEQGVLRRREGPRYGAIDPEIRRPRTDEFLIAVIQDFGRGWFLSAAGYMREGRDLIETENIGLPTEAYVPTTIFDAGDDRIPGNYDDLFFNVFSQKPETLGLDFFLLSNPGGASRLSTYKGFDFVLVKRPTDRSLFFLALTATEATQMTSPGNTEWENDDGVVGALYDNPNAEINARGRPRFDRAYTARLGGFIALPLGFSAGVVVKYYDGQPFARKIVVTGFPQGPFTIMAHPRGDARYEFNMTADARIEKRFRLGRRGTVRLMADVFNLFNQHLATAESAWTNPAFPLRYATEIESPRVARLGLNFEF